MNTIFLYAPQGTGTGGGGSSIFFLLLMLVVFYFFFIRPQMRRSKEQKVFRESLQKGTKVKTIGGIHGKIVEMQDTTVTIEIEGQNRLKIDKTAITPITTEQTATKS